MAKHLGELSWRDIQPLFTHVVRGLKAIDCAGSIGHDYSVYRALENEWHRAVESMKPRHDEDDDLCELDRPRLEDVGIMSSDATALTTIVRELSAAGCPRHTIETVIKTICVAGEISTHRRREQPEFLAEWIVMVVQADTPVTADDA
jgi:hypothetical protein